MRKPNFFIVGAPKCGTTALSEYLRSHPNIFMSWRKEPHYFAEDIHNYPWIASLNEYMALFQQSTSEHMAVGEASIFYLYSSVAIRNIHQFNPNAKIVVMLRNPVDLVYSYHSQAVHNFWEDERNFEVAWRLQSVRRNGRHIPRTCPHPKLLQYIQVAKLGAQVERLLSIFEPDQVKVIVFDDFVTSTQVVYEDVLSFLEVPFDGRTDFPRINENKVYKWHWLAKFAKSLPRHKHLFHMGRNAKMLFGLEHIPVLCKVKEMNTKRAKRQPLSPAFRNELVEAFHEDIKKLSRLISRDLSNWHTP